MALTIFGTGLLSLSTDRDVIATPGLGSVPGPLAAGVSAIAFAATLWPVLRGRPRYTSVIGVVLAVVLAHLVALWVLALVFGADLALATAAVGDVATSWTVVVFAGSAAVAAWAAVAVRRTAAHRPRWPWERDEDE